MPKELKNESSEFDSVMQELESFSKSYTKMGEEEEELPKRKVKAKKEEVADPNEEEAEEQVPSMTKSVNDEGQAMDAEAFMGEFLKKSKILVVDATKEAATESMKVSALMAKAIVEQGRLMKSFVEDLADMREALEEQGQKPRMRKSVLNIQDRQHGQTPSNEQAQGGIPAATVLAKCVGDNGLVAKGVVTPSQVSQVQYYANRNQELPANLKYLEQHV